MGCAPSGERSRNARTTGGGKLRLSTLCIILIVALVMALDWLLAVACSRHDQRQDYADRDEADGTHEVKFDEQDSGQ